MENTLFNKLLTYFQITEEEYHSLNNGCTLNEFSSSNSFDNGLETANFVKQCIKQHKKIVIYGDYDGDGIMGTTILVKMFQYINYPVDYYLPNRYVDGYGINENRAKQFIDSGYELVITVDNGVSAFIPIEMLRKANIDVVVLDHHEVQDNKLPNANYIMHPILSHFSEIPSSGAFTAFMFSYYILNKFDEYLATLASISLITDMMPLVDYNRKLFKAIMDTYKKGNYFALDLLLGDSNFDETAIGMTLGPKINSLGRILNDDRINDVIKFLTTDDKEFILNYNSFINDTNDNRKKLTSEAYSNIDITDDKKCIVIVDDNLLEGLIGLVASNISNNKHIPCVVFTKSNEEGVYKGSARAPKGFNIFNCFTALKDHLINFGGHAGAGGCSIKKEELDQFINSFNEYVNSCPNENVIENNIEISLCDINYENYKLIRSFAPFGENWKAPKFLLKNIKVNALTYTKNQNAVRTIIGYNSLLIGFKMTPAIMKHYSYIDTLGNLRYNIFNGRGSVEYLIESFKESEK